MDEVAFLEGLFDPKLINVIKVLVADQRRQFYLKEISDKSKVPMATAHRIIKKLVKLEILQETSISKFKIYQLAENERVSFLMTFIKGSVKLVEQFVDRIKGMPGIKRIMMHGKEGENRANILIIGENVESRPIMEIAADIKEREKFTISYLTLTEEQYQQMSNMGLYSGTKRILHETGE